MTEDLARTPIAIVGVSALTPGASDVAGLWRCVLTGQDLITDVPASRWLVEDYYDPDPRAEDKTYGKRGAFLSPVAFDALGFGMPPNNVAATDTTQLLALIAAERVLADATGGDLDSLDRDRVSVVLGTAPLDLLVSMSSRLQRPVWRKALREHGVPESQAQSICDTIAGSYVPWQEASFPGLLSNVVAGRIANRFDLHGVNHTVDAACASSLAALLSAMNELQLGRSDLVVTGGVDTLNDILMYMCFSKTPALSPTGDCRPFSEAADGTMLGEGLVMFALKRLADAERDGNNIYAVIRGLGTSSDGRSTAIYAPLADGQSRALDRAYQAAGYGPDTVELVEAHGTGTVAGDGAEVAALRAVFDAAGRTDRQWCALGSVKSQIGHTKSAAGAVGLLKAVLALQHQILPPTIKVDRPNPSLELESSPFYLNTQARPWIRGKSHPRRASVSSFGFGGSNFHVTVEEYVPGPDGGHAVTDGQVTPRGQAAKRVRALPTELVLLGAATADALLARCGEVAALDQPLAEIARESQCNRWQSAQVRLGVVVGDTDDLKAKLSQAAALIKKNPGASWSLPTGLHYGASPAPQGGIAFLFPGQGSQYVGMGADIAMAYPQSRSAWDWAADIKLGSQRLHEVVFPPPAFTEADRDSQQARLTATEWAQPALAVASLAALGLLDALGITPDCVAGHSFGELVALHVAGSYDRPTLLRLARLRGELMRDASSAPGAMLAVAASAQDAKAVLASADADELWLANDNGPAQVVLSGTATAVEAAAEHCQRAGIQARRLNAATAFHSPIVTPAGAPLLEFLLGADVRQPQLPAYGNTDAALYPADPDAIRQRIAAHLSAPVRFADEIEAMYAAGTHTFIEVGAGATLSGLVGGILGDRPHLAVSLDRKNQNGATSLHNALAQLAVHGLDMNLEALWEPYAAPPAPRQTQPTRATLMIGGGNYGQPYSPEAGAAGLPGPSQAPQPPMRQDAAPSQAPPSPANWDPNGPAASRALHPAVARAAAPHQAPFHGESLPQWSLSAPSATSTGPDIGWLHALQEANRETAEAHASYQRLMADSHAAFLQMAEGSLARFAATANGRPIAAVSHVPAERAYVLPASPPPPAAELLTVPDQRAPGPDGPAPPPSIADAVDPGVLAATAATAQPCVASVRPEVDLESLVLAAVAEATGYPEDMLGPDMQLEADLGIDSIKRVQILSKLREALPGLPEFRAADIGKFQTLGSIVTALRTTAQEPPAGPQAEAGPSDSSPADSDALPAPPVSTEPNTDRPLARRVVRVAAAPACGFAMAGLSRGPIVVTDDGAGLANLVVGGLAAHGVAATVADEVPIDAPGLIFLGGMRTTGTVDAAVNVNREAFQAARTIAPRLAAEGGVFVTVQDTGGDFGLGARAADRAWLGGLAALALTALREWPHASVRAVDCERGDRSAAEIAAAIVRELLTGGATPQVGLRADGTRLVPEVAAGAVGASAVPHVGPDSVIVATGGGRGVTATALRALAATHQPAIALLGRTELAEEPPEARGIDDERSLQRVFIEVIRAQTGTAPAPAQVGARVAQVRQAREVRATIDALQRAGSRVRYLAVDVCDADAVAAALADVRRDWGPVTGLIHGAGVLADKNIADKTDQQFARVFDTKVKGLRALLAATAVDPLRLICLFSSVAARYGNAGQSDYAMANAVLDQVASAEAARRPDCVVRAMGWGPWDGGMVTPSLATHFRDRGVALIRPEAGGQAFVAEMAGARGDVQVVVTGDEDDPLGGPERAGLAAEIRISDRSHPHLDDHRVADVPVVPVALVLDWFAVATDETIGRLVPLVVRDLDVLRGIGLDHFGNGGNCLTVRARHQPREARPHLALELTGDSGSMHYRASVDLNPQPGVAGTGWAPLASLEPAGSRAIYDGKVLFHGPSFQALRALHGLSHSGAVADVAGVTEMSWPGGPWRTDPAAIDGGLQLALLWGERVLGGPSLPMSVRECRIHRDGPAEGTVRCVLRAVRTAHAHAECDIALLDPDGAARAELLGVTVVGRPR
jgi:acyl transferase domain-containing protein/NADP-dependent 3-hydroxy acid dehydrogenase YdfG